MQGRQGGRLDDRRTVDALTDASGMQLDDVARAFVVRQQRASQAAARAPVAPENVFRRSFQKAAGEECGLAGGEAFECIRGVRAREPVRAVPPGEQAFRHDRQGLARSQQPEDEVVVLGPAFIAKAQARQDFSSQREGRVRDGALDERLGADLVRRGDGVQPGLVASSPVGQAGPREDPHLATHARQPGLAIEGVELQCQAVAMHPVVGVHARHDWRATGREPVVEAFDDAAVGLREHPEARVRRCGSFQERACAVPGTVVDDHALEARLALAADAVEADRQGRPGVERRQQDRDAGFAQAVLYSRTRGWLAATESSTLERMAYKHRTLTTDDLDAAWDLDVQVFHTDGLHRAAFYGLSAPDRFHGAFDAKGRLVAMARVIPFGQYFGGRRVSMGGLSSVGVAPEARGRGLAAAVSRAALADMRERGEAISSLYPGSAGLYRKLGWELSGAHTIRHIDCSALRQLRPPADRRVLRAEPSDRARVRACYERIAPTINGFLERVDSRWYFLDKMWDEFHVYLSVDSAGEVDGYVAYRQEAPASGQHGYTIRVRDWMAGSRNALASLFWTLGSGSTQAAVVSYPSSPEDPLLLLLDDQVERVHGDIRVMTRIVDPAEAVAQRGFAPALTLDVPFVLVERGATDEASSLAANAGAWRLQLSKGVGRLERTGDDAPGVPRLSVAGFASLYTGWAQTALLERAGLLEGGSAAERADLDAAFAGPTPWLPEEF